MEPAPVVFQKLNAPRLKQAHLAGRCSTCSCNETISAIACAIAVGSKCATNICCAEGKTSNRRRGRAGCGLCAETSVISDESVDIASPHSTVLLDRTYVKKIRPARFNHPDCCCRVRRCRPNDQRRASCTGCRSGEARLNTELA